ncbi:TetR/AcrR family transcriptional regulator [Citricoccus zhacaiensis]|nr:TetR/AcrR family transcriptional regulator [Citricoccus zhacaiensis]
MRGQILEAARRMLETQGSAFSLPDLAREAGVGTATIYRHFSDVDGVLHELVQQSLGELTRRLEGLESKYSGRELFTQVCATWVDSALTWASWAARFRSGEGFLVRSQDALTNEFHHRQFLERVLRSLEEEGVARFADPGSLVVLWVALFDERVMHDLQSHRLTQEDITRRLTGAMGALLDQENN